MPYRTLGLADEWNNMNNPTNEMDDQPVRYSNVLEIDESKIPEKFRHLTNYANAWSISDDAIRADVMARSSYEEKKEFVDEVDPFLSDIEDWCMALFAYS